MQLWEVFHRVARNFSIRVFVLPRISNVARKAQIGQSFKSMTGENAMKAGGGFEVRKSKKFEVENFGQFFLASYYPSYGKLVG